MHAIIHGQKVELPTGVYYTLVEVDDSGKIKIIGDEGFTQQIAAETRYHVELMNPDNFICSRRYRMDALSEQAIDAEIVEVFDRLAAG